jgi:Icc protein
MLIAQITDIHLGFEQDNPDERNRRRLDATLRTLATMNPRPDLLLMTGDLADLGDDDLSYQRLKEATAGLPFPVYPLVGNHDDRAAFVRAFLEIALADGFVQYAIEGYVVRILVLDTLADGRHGGRFCEARAAWLRARLDEQPERPTLIALHHPPVESGLSWMGENPESAWMKRLADVVARHTNVLALVGGHFHRPVVTRFAGTVLVVCPATAPQLALDLGTIDPDVQDGRPMILEEPPGFALHKWTGRSLVTHFGTVEGGAVLARHEANFEKTVRHLLHERQNPERT